MLTALDSEIPPRQASIQERQCIQPPRPTPDRSNPSKQLNKLPTEVTPSLFPQAGKLQYFLDPWMQLTQDSWILDTVRGYQIPFRERPPNRQIPAFTFTETESKLISAEVGELLRKQAISRTVSDDSFISNIFLVPKGKGIWRLILNLKALNLYIEHQHFKMEDIRCVKDLLNRGDYMCKLDLKDAYLSIPITQSHRKYLKFAWQGTVYQYNVLPFGLATAPRAFTKLMKPALAYLRSKGVRLIAYLDDILIIGRDKGEAERHIKMRRA